MSRSFIGISIMENSSSHINQHLFLNFPIKIAMLALIIKYLLLLLPDVIKKMEMHFGKQGPGVATYASNPSSWRPGGGNQGRRQSDFSSTQNIITTKLNISRKG